jgi:hypothetical protein
MEIRLAESHDRTGRGDCCAGHFAHLVFLDTDDSLMTAERKKPTAAFWITVALVAVLVGYPLSQGPMLWVYIAHSEPVWMDPLLHAYRPINILKSCLPRSASKPYRKYCFWWIGRAMQSPSRERGRR